MRGVEVTVLLDERLSIGRAVDGRREGNEAALANLLTKFARADEVEGIDGSSQTLRWFEDQIGGVSPQPLRMMRIRLLPASSMSCLVRRVRPVTWQICVAKSA